WFGSTDPHRPYEEGSGGSSGIDADRIQVPPFLPDADSVRADIADYYFEVERFDREVGELLEELERRGELGNTVLVITSDNGMPFPRAKANLYDAGVRVPLIAWWPGHFPGERRIDDFVSLTDLAPTFLELAGQDVPSEMTGRSLVDLLTNSAEEWPTREFILAGKERHVPCQDAPESGGTPMRAIRTRDFLYIYNFAPDRWPAGTPDYENAFIPGSWYGDVDNGPTKEYMVDHRDEETVRPLYRLAFEKRPARELYDLTVDPWQMENLAEDPDYQDTRDELHLILMEELRNSEDPRVIGEEVPFDSYPYFGGTPLAPTYEGGRQ
ncbi:MAG TPA: sulfatase/phosphatase domain-containing protein, partial [Acidobacteriota bacterium]|nr:sulfatase/phosphatase domain-containing protein [Acidobacteriota bacterium]